MKPIRFNKGVNENVGGADISIFDYYIFLPYAPSADESYLEAIDSQVSALGWQLVSAEALERTYLCPVKTGPGPDCQVSVTVSAQPDRSEVIFSIDLGVLVAQQE